jgi:hypothetical protein
MRLAPQDRAAEGERSAVGMVFHSRRLVLLAGALVVLVAACGAAEEKRLGREAGRAELLPGVGVTVPVGDRDIAGVAVGEGAVWVATWDFKAASVWRIDPEGNEVVATIPLEDVQGVAAGEGAVWVVGGSCVEPLPEDPDVCRLDPWVARIDPRTNEAVATIPLDPPPGLDSIDARGHPGEVAVGAGAVWVLSDPALTDESDRGASLHRIDPRTNEIAATPLREQLSHIGGTVMPSASAADSSPPPSGSICPEARNRRGVESPPPGGAQLSTECPLVAPQEARSPGRPRERPHGILAGWAPARRDLSARGATRRRGGLSARSASSRAPAGCSGSAGRRCRGRTCA